MSKDDIRYPALGFGLGLRTDHYGDIFARHEAAQRVDWFEAISENFMVDGGQPLHFLGQIRRDYPLVLHGVSLSIGSADPVDQNYLKRLRAIADRFEPAWISDHLCWTGVHGVNMHDLLPLPYTGEALDHVARRIAQVQEVIGRRLVIENVSSYVEYRHSTMPEWEFLAAVAERADCLLLFDVNNVFVSAFNHEFDPLTYVDAIPARRVQQFHLAGHENNRRYIIDTHDHPIVDDVWALYRAALRRFGPVSTMVERDANIPPLAELVAELDHARAVAELELGKEAAA
ncbi:MAG TPA: DUF692 domain-containing protein [Candidatus Polarisedimenticolia bacterium]|nr:DUF692 domain-containing protein [Candidatus Polarisedimenticolia bacterium]